MRHRRIRPRVCVRVGGWRWISIRRKNKKRWREIRGKHPDIDWMQSCGRLSLSHTPINQANHSVGCFSAMMTMKCRQRGRPNPLPKDTTRGGKQFIVCVQLVQWNEKKTENIVSNWITWRPNGETGCRNSIAKRQSYSQKSCLYNFKQKSPQNTFSITIPRKKRKKTTVNKLSLRGEVTFGRRAKGSRKISWESTIKAVLRVAQLLAWRWRNDNFSFLPEQLETALKFHCFNN